MKRSYLFAIVLGFAMSAILKLFNIEMDTILWWVILIPTIIVLVLIYFKLKS